MWLAILTVGLWPFNFQPANQVSWVQERSGLSFDWDGIAYSPTPIDLRTSGLLRDAVSVELWIKPARKTFRYYADILALYRHGHPVLFAIGQRSSDLQISGFYPRIRDRSPYRNRTVSDVFRPEDSQFLTIASSAEGTFIYERGSLRASFPDAIPIAEGLMGQIVLGHSPSGYRPWAGQLYGVAVYNTMLGADDARRNYRLWTDHAYSPLATQQGVVALFAFDEGRGFLAHNRVPGGEGLLIPSSFRPMERTILQLPSRRDLLDFRDVAINVLGFVPFGYLATWYFLAVKNYRTPYAVIVGSLVGAGTSVAIELLQTYLPSRSSSMADVISNSIGTVVGTVLAGKFGQPARAHPSRPRRLGP